MEESVTSARNSAWSFGLCNVRGIPIRVHVSFFLLLLWVGIEELQVKGDAVGEVIFVMALFGCIVFHELGHALVARWYGIRTRDIVLYPFGGIASLVGTATPLGELWIALAGPLVNIIIAIGLFPLTTFSEQLASPSGDAVFGLISFTDRLVASNIFLAIFNMLPAFPMDGGRVLRSLLAIFKVRSATVIAARTSQALSLGLAALAVYSGNAILFVIAAFVFLNAMQEIARESAHRAAVGRTAQDIMIERPMLHLFSHGMTIEGGLRIALKALQEIFPVMHGEEILGYVRKDALINTVASEEDASYVASIVERDFIPALPSDPLDVLLERTRQSGGDSPILVRSESGSLVGLITKERLLESLIVYGITSSAQQRNLPE